ncbi:MAG: baseplate J/gp47 family protein [Mariprofundus sp.]|nr:baseplate J/gp47 family protein [Mariprofundus sp.]
MGVDLSTLPFPEVIEDLSYEAILQDLIVEFQGIMPDYQPLESDMYMPLFEVFAYREMHLRHRINSASKSLLLTYAVGSDLEHIAFTYYNGTSRLVVDPGDDNATPPRPVIYESDDRLRERCRLSLYAYSTAGPIGAYKFHAMTASADIKDVKVAKHTPAPGDVTLYVLSTIGNGIPTQAVLDAVTIALDDEETRPINDSVFVQAAEIIDWTLDVRLIVYPDANTTLVLEKANAAAVKFVAEHHALGHDITVAALGAALIVPGVMDVTYIAPLQNLVVGNHQAPFNTSINIVIGGYDV